MTFLNKQFKYFDISNKGVVDFEQFQRAVEKIGVVMTRFNLEQVFKRYDVSGDGNLDFKEFSNMFVQKVVPQAPVEEQTQPKRASAVQDPYIQEKRKQELSMTSSSQETPDNLLKLFRDKIKNRGVRGMVGLQRVFNMMDDDNTGTLSMREFAKACKDFKVGISEENVPILFQKFDANGDGTMSYDEFLTNVRGILNPTRGKAIRAAFQNLADRCGGRFTVDYVKKIYNASRHLDVIQSKRTEDNVLVEFIETFDAHHNLGGEDPYVTADEWEDYFHSLSAVSDNEQYFLNNLTNVFGIKADSPSKKEAQAAMA